MKYILIYSIVVGQFSSVATGTAIFDTKEACEIAGQLAKDQFVSKFRGFTIVAFVCVPSKDNLPK